MNSTSPFTSALERLSDSLKSSSSSSTSNQPKHHACTITLLRVIDNILQDPHRTNPKVRKIKVNNPAFWKRSGQWEGSVDFLVACGFIPLGEIATLTYVTPAYGAPKQKSVPQHLKFDGDDDAGRIEHLMRGRESLVQFAEHVLEMDGKILPPCPVQSQPQESDDSSDSMMVRARDDIDRTKTASTLSTQKLGDPHPSDLLESARTKSETSVDTQTVSTVEAPKTTNDENMCISSNRTQSVEDDAPVVRSEHDDANVSEATPQISFQLQESQTREQSNQMDIAMHKHSEGDESVTAAALKAVRSVPASGVNACETNLAVSSDNTLAVSADMNNANHTTTNDVADDLLAEIYLELNRMATEGSSIVERDSNHEKGAAIFAIDDVNKQQLLDVQVENEDGDRIRSDNCQSQDEEHSTQQHIDTVDISLDIELETIAKVSTPDDAHKDDGQLSVLSSTSYDLARLEQRFRDHPGKTTEEEAIASTICQEESSHLSVAVEEQVKASEDDEAKNIVVTTNDTNQDASNGNAATDAVEQNGTVQEDGEPLSNSAFESVKSDDKRNAVYEELLANVSLPDGEFAFAEGVEVQVFRSGFELCHRSLLPVFSVSADITTHSITSGLVNLQPWKTESSETITTENELGAKECQHSKPVVLVPLSIAYVTWACVLGLGSSCATLSSDSDDLAGTRSATMYSWIASNNPSLSTLDGIPAVNSSLCRDASLPSSVISVCNLVCNSLRNIGLITIYGADVVGGTDRVSSDLTFFIGVDSTVVDKLTKNDNSIILGEKRVIDCHGALARAVYPRVIELLDEINSPSPSGNGEGESGLWYSCQHCIRHLIASNQLNDVVELLLSESFVRKRLHVMGTLRGTIAHSSECAAMNARSYATLKARQCNGLQSDDDESSTVAIKWRESCFKSLLLVSTILREMVGELFPSDSSARRIKGEIGSSFQVIGELIGDMGGHSAEEMEHLEEALKLKTEACGDDQNNESIADTLYAMGCHHQRHLNFTFAQKCYENALRIYKAALGHSHPSVAKVLHNIGIMYTFKNNADVAMKCFKNSMSIRISALGESDLSVADSLCWLGNIHRENEDYAEARDCFLRAHSTKAAVLGDNHPECAEILHNTGVGCDDLGLHNQR
eukprot:scaffold13329_cov209-Alexandrium_tamarense.AAC.9